MIQYGISNFSFHGQSLAKHGAKSCRRYLHDSIGFQVRAVRRCTRTRAKVGKVPTYLPLGTLALDRSSLSCAGHSICSDSAALSFVSCWY